VLHFQRVFFPRADSPMANPAESAHIVRFGDFELDLRTAELRTDGHHIVLQEKPFQILTALLERPGVMISREELSKRLWPAGTFVDFNLGLNKAVNRLREALNDSAEQPRFIETFPKRGYRFVAPVAEVTRAEADSRSRDAQGRSPMRRWKLPTAAAVIIVALVAGGIYWRRSHQLTTLAERDTIVLSDFAASPQQPTLRPLTSLAGNVTSPTFSPDGKQIAFGWDGETNGAGWDLYVKAMGLDKPRRLTHHPATRLSAAWSPDGSNIVVSRVAGKSDTGVYLIPATGGPERELASASFGSWYGNDISWSPDGKQLAFTDHPPASPLGTELLFLLSLDTLERKPVKTDNCKLTENPSFSPHGDLLAWVCVDTWSSVSLHVSRMSDGHTERLLQGIDGIPGIAWSEDGRRMADAKHHTEVDFFDFNSQKVRTVFTLGKSLPNWSGGVSISSDGKWLLYPQLDGSSSDLMMIENWK
jgi:DNA-binding winged helix-turn-helix (wHTH) protein